MRVRHGIFSRPSYAYGVFSAATLAQRLGVSGISVVEFGVAGGRGLKALQEISTAIERATGVQIRVTGFDSGTGMPEPVDYRDLPHVWGKGFYAMDPGKLTSVLSSGTELILGELREVLATWLAGSDRFPLGFASFDLDYYSSTVAAFEVFKYPNTSSRLPRVYCYFDDIIWPEAACYNDFTGELCAIREFNEQYEYKKIVPIHLLRRTRIHDEAWSDQMYVFHDFQHPQYCVNLTPSTARARQLPL
jgi:hypothetical protein